MSHFYQSVHIDRLRTAIRYLKPHILGDRVPLTAEYAVTKEPVLYADRLSLDYKPISEGALWGDKWECGWFHLTGKLPKGWAGKRVVLELDFTGEACVYDAKGCPDYSLTTGSAFDGDYNKNLYPLVTSAKGGDKIDLWVETGANQLFGLNQPFDTDYKTKDPDLHGTYPAVLKACRARVLDYDKWQLWLDLTVLENLIGALPDGSARRVSVLRQVSKALNVLGTEGAGAAREALKPVYALGTDPAAPDVYGVGHAHIDTAWLWPVRETVRKCARTFASQIHNIETYPDYVFGESQAQLYEFTKTYYPKLYAKIKKAVAEGRWEIQGGMWVEADCNIPSGESLVRQFLVGKNFFRDEFGVEVKNLWLPDVFGYSGNLPQILQRAGMGYFLTQKLSWNAYNKFPHNTFWWRGIDGSKVLAHFPPEDDYNSRIMPAALRRHELNNAEAGLVQEAMCLFGIGDGGGGPAENFIERGLRCKNLNGCPRFHFGFAQPTLEKMAKYGDELDTWDGELYFELHRGTYTTQAGIKLWNRRAEEAFRAAEMLLAAADIKKYPRAEMLALWKKFLINEFHDIIPGSSIHRVYAEQVPALQAVVKRLKELQAGAAARLLAREDGALTLFNPSSTAFAGAVALPDGWKSADGLPCQAEDGAVLALVSVPPRSFVTLREGKKACARAAAKTQKKAVVLENDLVRYTLDPATLQVAECFDKELGRALVVPSAPGNRIELFEDIPHCYDAWDVEEYAYDMKTDSARVTSLSAFSGPVRQGVVAKMSVGESALVQKIVLEAGSKRLDFVTDVDWRENHKWLRAAFPTTVQTQEARFEIQYGTVARPTHTNTKWQAAQFESMGHRFADMSEKSFGLALLNDSKYGYRAKDGELSISLLRAPTYPDPEADRGANHFVYSILPHTGALEDSDVLAHAARLNQGVERFENLACAAASAPAPLPLSAEGVEMTVAKCAEKESAWIFRLVELKGVRTQAKLALAEGAGRLVEVDLMEWNELGEVDTTKPLEFGPFAIRTFKLVK